MSDFQKKYELIYEDMMNDVRSGNGRCWLATGIAVYDSAYESFIERDTSNRDSSEIRYGIAQCVLHATIDDVELHLLSPLTDTLDEARHGEGILAGYDCRLADDSNVDAADGLHRWELSVVVVVHGIIDPAAAADACLMSHALRLESVPDWEEFERSSEEID